MKYHTLLTNLDWLIIVSAIAVTVAVFYFNKLFKNKNNSTLEYMLMGRRLTLPIFVSTLVATWYAGIIGVTQISYGKGVYNFITQGFFWYIAAIIFALFFLNKSREMEVLSFPEMIKKAYGEKSAKLTAVLLYFKVLPIPYAIALGIFLNGFLGFSLNISIIIGMLLVAIHCIYGGLRAIIACDIVQFIFMFIAIIVVVVVSYLSFGGIEYLQTNLPESYFSAKANESWSTVIVWFFIALNTTILSPIFYQRCFAVKDTKTAKRGIFISIIFWMICDFCTTAGGLYAKAHMPNLNPNDAYLVYALTILPDGIRGLFLVGILFTVLSALDSFLFIASSIISYDLMPEKYQASSKIRRWAIILSALLTTLLSFSFDGHIEQAWLTLETFFMAGLFVPVILGILKPNIITDKQCAYTIILSSTSAIAWKLCGGEEFINMFYIGNTVSLIMIYASTTNNLKRMPA
jgi:solute:Na+ symporter, SSS family